VNTLLSRERKTWIKKFTGVPALMDLADLQNSGFLMEEIAHIFLLATRTNLIFLLASVIEAKIEAQLVMAFVGLKTLAKAS
jgi:hypothetical protein